MDAVQLIDRINWELLRDQKQTLLEVIQEKADRFTPKANEQCRALEGILNLIDSIQDTAVDHMGVDPARVYLFEEE